MINSKWYCQAVHDLNNMACVDTEGVITVLDDSEAPTAEAIKERIKQLEEQSILQSKLKQLKQAYIQANLKDIEYMNTTFQADKESQALIVSVLSAGSVPEHFYWLDTANNKIPMTYSELQGLSAAILVRGQTNFTKYQNLKEQVKSASTQEELDAINW